MYQELKRGNVSDLLGYTVPSGNLTVLVGYGPNIFKLEDMKRSLPNELGSQNQFRSPLPTGGGLLLRNSGLIYADDIRVNLATEEIVVQFIAETQLAVNRAVVETWKIIQDMIDPEIQAAPLLLTSFYSGFQRDDGRSWLDFHDGLSNMRSEEREKAISIKCTRIPEDKWTEGGTYLAFLRLGIDLSVWRTLDSQQQEILVGRDKLSGCPLISINQDGKPIIIDSCPVTGTADVFESANEQFRETPNVSNQILRQSHVHRANKHVTPINDRNSLRVFRQGYEFLEPAESTPGFRTGLNFVSFQDTPERLRRILAQDGWLGGINFGGDLDNQLPGMDRLLTVRSAGVFLVPPVVEGEVFPGSNIFFS